MKFLLDTNICIYIMKNKPAEVVQKFSSISFGQIGISSITLAELEYGVSKSKFPDKNLVNLRKFILPLEILEFGSRAASEYGKIRAKLESEGRPIGALDTLIAAHAKSEDLILVTNNSKEFIRVDGLKTENWIS
jgi:tRNA(fMet)-specific endonuclease VapC